jgi:hypothetical protein
MSNYEAFFPGLEKELAALAFFLEKNCLRARLFMFGEADILAEQDPEQGFKLSSDKPLSIGEERTTPETSTHQDFQFIWQVAMLLLKTDGPKFEEGEIDKKMWKEFKSEQFRRLPHFGVGQLTIVKQEGNEKVAVMLTGFGISDQYSYKNHNANKSVTFEFENEKLAEQFVHFFSFDVPFSYDEEIGAIQEELDSLEKNTLLLQEAVTQVFKKTGLSNEELSKRFPTYSELKKAKIILEKNAEFSPLPNGEAHQETQADGESEAEGISCNPLEGCLSLAVLSHSGVQAQQEFVDGKFVKAQRVPRLMKNFNHQQIQEFFAGEYSTLEVTSKIVPIIRLKTGSWEGIPNGVVLYLGYGKYKGSYMVFNFTDATSQQRFVNNFTRGEEGSMRNAEIINQIIATAFSHSHQKAAATELFTTSKALLFKLPESRDSE